MLQSLKNLFFYHHHHFVEQKATGRMCQEAGALVWSAVAHYHTVMVLLLLQGNVI